MSAAKKRNGIGRDRTWSPDGGIVFAAHSAAGARQPEVAGSSASRTKSQEHSLKEHSSERQERVAAIRPPSDRLQSGAIDSKMRIDKNARLSVNSKTTSRRTAGTRSLDHQVSSSYEAHQNAVIGTDSTPSRANSTSSEIIPALRTPCPKPDPLSEQPHSKPVPWDEPAQKPTMLPQDNLSTNGPTTQTNPESAAPLCSRSRVYKQRLNRMQHKLNVLTHELELRRNHPLFYGRRTFSSGRKLNNHRRDAFSRRGSPGGMRPSRRIGKPPQKFTSRLPSLATAFSIDDYYYVQSKMRLHPAKSLENWLEGCHKLSDPRLRQLLRDQISFLFWQQQTMSLRENNAKSLPAVAEFESSLWRRFYVQSRELDRDSGIVSAKLRELEPGLAESIPYRWSQRWKTLKYEYLLCRKLVGRASHHIRSVRRHQERIKNAPPGYMIPTSGAQDKIYEMCQEFAAAYDAYSKLLHVRRRVKFSRLHAEFIKVRIAYTNTESGLAWLEFTRHLQDESSMESYRANFFAAILRHGEYRAPLREMDQLLCERPSASAPEAEMVKRSLSDAAFARLRLLIARIRYLMETMKEIDSLLKEYRWYAYQRSRLEVDGATPSTERHRIRLWLCSHRVRLAKAIEHELKHDKYYSYTRSYPNSKGRDSTMSWVLSKSGQSNHSTPLLANTTASCGAKSQQKPWYAAGPRHGQQVNAIKDNSLSPRISSRKRTFSTMTPSSDVSNTDVKKAPSVSYNVSPPALQQACDARAKGDLDACWTYKLYHGPDGKPPLTHYCRTLCTSEEYAKLFLHEPLLGFDLEWKPNTAAKGGSIKEGISTIQLASESHIAIFHIALHAGSDPSDLVAPTLKHILENPDTIKAGVSVLGDRTRLANYLGIRINAAFDLSHLYRVVKYTNTQPKLVNRVGVSLTTQCEEHLGLPLNKDENVRGSDWSKPLNMEQVVYAASDAYVAVHLYHKMNQLRLEMVPVPDMPEWAELKADRDARPKERRRPVDPNEPVEDEELTCELLDDGDYTPPPSRASTSTPSTSRSTPSQRTPKPKPPQPPPCAELLTADAWVATYHTQATAHSNPSMTLPPRILRTHHLFHHQQLSIPRIARLLRTPPLANFTVASYIAEAVCGGGLEVDVGRTKEVSAALGPGRARRWEFVVGRREVEGQERGREGSMEEEQVAGGVDEVDQVVGGMGRLGVADDDGGHAGDAGEVGGGGTARE